MPVKPIQINSPEALLSRPGRTIVYKHSPTCSLSQWAEVQVERLADEDALEIHRVDVLSQRPLSQAIEAQFGVRHESPQMLVIEDGRVVWHASHRALTVTGMRAALQGAGGPMAGARM